jgi:FKBP-type peptidyl-prolyl cis-trans isomerase FkpA
MARSRPGCDTASTPRHSISTNRSNFTQIPKLTERNPLMKSIQQISLILIACIIGACGGTEPPKTIQAIPDNPADMSIDGFASEEIVPGLSKRTLIQGDGPVAEVGHMVSVHYTGWLYDAEAENFRGAKFDSSVDRGAHFRFRLGEGRVISGWDHGVVGMHIGGVGELTIAPALA